jgi:hypothetical protein
MNDIVRVKLDLIPINPEQDSEQDYDEEYTISVRRKDGKGMPTEEAEALLFQYFAYMKTGGALAKFPEEKQ